MRRDIWAGLLFLEAAHAVRLEAERDMFPMLKFCNEEFVEEKLVPILGQTKAHSVVFKNSTTRKDELEHA